MEKNVIITAKNVDFYYGSFRALTDVTMDFEKNRVTALIGPSGCGKSTLLRLLNRMNDLILGTRVEGEILLEGRNIYAPDVDPVEIRRRVGMVFQKPNPFPKSILTILPTRRSCRVSRTRPNWKPLSNRVSSRPSCGTRSRIFWTGRP